MQFTADTAEERDELATRIATIYMAGMTPEPADLDRAAELGLDTTEIRRTVDACFTEDTL